MTTSPSSPAPRGHRGRTGFEAGADALRHQLRTMPERPGVYRMLATDGAVLYVGKAKNLKKRVGSYTQRARLPNRLQRMVARVRGVEVTITGTEAEALLLEANLIQRYEPPFNVLLRDDKSYPFIMITRDHAFPLMAKHRGAQKRKGWYFGPFVSAGAVAETLVLLQRGFMLRSCSDSDFAGRSRPCLQYHIKRCTAPCVGKVDEAAYARQVEDARAFLSGRSAAIQEGLAEAMQTASDAQDYERAAILRDRIKVLTAMQARQDIAVAGVGDADVFALHQEAGQAAVQMFAVRGGRNYGTRCFFPALGGQETSGETLAALLAQFYADKPVPPLIILSHAPENAALLSEALARKADHAVALVVPQRGARQRLVAMALTNAETALGRRLADARAQSRLLAEVAEVFGLAAPPKRIEVYDNSHLSGTNAVGAMIAAGPDGFIKSGYRKFTIRDAPTDDDFAMMREVLGRRFRRLAAEDPDRASGAWPDLVLIDGGKGQLSSTVAVLESLGITGVALIGVAKGPDRNAGREQFHTPDGAVITLPHDSPALYYLQRLRDEAHRFAITTHRARRTRDIARTGLDDVPGIGAARKRALLHHFGSAKAVQGAGIDDIARAQGISLALARKIHGFFHPDG